jgi:hypothetical protein
MASNKTWMSDSSLEEALARVQPALAAWRLRRRHREAIPESLWRMILPLARAHGVSPVARALRVNYTTLKERTVGGANGSNRPVEKQADNFIEVPVATLGPWSASSQWTIELEDRHGAKLTLRLAQAESATALELAQGLWSRRQ